MLGVASYQEAIVPTGLFPQGGQAVPQRLCRIVFVVDALGACWGGEVLELGLLAVISCLAGCMAMRGGGHV